MRTSADIDQALNDELVAARILSEMGFRPAQSANRRGAGYGGTDAPSSLIRNADGDTFERGSRTLTMIHAAEAEAIERARERGEVIEPGSCLQMSPEHTRELWAASRNSLPLVMGGQGMTDAEMLAQGKIATGIILAVLGVACILIVAGLIGGGV